MATTLAIGYLANQPGNPVRSPAPARSAHVSEHDSITSRPPIPRAVVTWPDPDAVCATARRRYTLDGVLIGVTAVLLTLLAATVAWQLDQPVTAWIARAEPSSPMVAAGRVPVVELRVLGFEPVATAESREADPVTISAADKSSTRAN
jgi:hypothetical protein